MIPKRVIKTNIGIMYLLEALSWANIRATAPRAAKLKERNKVFLAPIEVDILPAAMELRASPMLITMTFLKGSPGTYLM